MMVCPAQEGNDCLSLQLFARLLDPDHVNKQVEEKKATDKNPVVLHFKSTLKFENGRYSVALP